MSITVAPESSRSPLPDPRSPFWSRAILHLDMDAFFVNVHLLDHPEDAGIPLVVGGRPEGRGVVASASYEARQFGIHSAMPAARALRLCPQLKFVGFNRPRIRACSQQVMAILERFGPVEKVSVDEAYVDLSASASPEEIARRLRTAVEAETHLPASVGLATSKLVAKVASDHDKPQGCTIVRPGEEMAFLAPLPVRAIWGIGPRSAERLAQLGIERCGQLAAADPARLQSAFGARAEALQARARGVDERPVQAESGPRKSLSQETTFAADVADPAVLRRHLAEMAAAVATALQERSLVASTVFVKFRWADFTTFTRQRTVEYTFDNAATIVRLAHALWEENWTAGQRVRLLGVGVSSISSDAARQLPLFDRS
ncbi:MAG: DNA polymerase IV [Anaerolineae bacterium]|nr:DNA polymerase IV [Anaerolineae bacterium]